MAPPEKGVSRVRKINKTVLDTVQHLVVKTKLFIFLPIGFLWFGLIFTETIDFIASPMRYFLNEHWIIQSFSLGSGKSKHTSVAPLAISINGFQTAKKVPFVEFNNFQFSYYFLELMSS